MPIACLIAAWTVASISGCAKPAPETKIRVSDETIWQARNAAFDYVGYLARAERGDDEAISKLLAFDRTDAAGGLGHGVVLVELTGIVGDAKMAALIRPRSREIKSLIRMHFLAGEAYAHPKLPKPLHELYPKSMQALEQAGDSPSR